MVETKVTKFAAASVLLFCFCLGAVAQDFKWSRVRIDGSRTGVTASSADNVSEAMGTMKGRKYISPSGRVFRGGSTPKVARLLLEAQAEMADVKQVVGWSPRAMVREYPECELSNWFVDELIRACAAKAGKPVSVGIANFGGIRVDMPAGEVLMDDLMSMFPFRNNLCYVELRGREIREILEKMAATRFQVLGGVRCVAEGGRLLSATVGGEALDDDKVYGVATISFLLNGGDGLNVAKNAVDLRIFDEYIIDVMLPYVKRLTAAGQPIEYERDGRVVILDAGREDKRK